MSARLTHNRKLSARIWFLSNILSELAANDRTFGILYRTMSESWPYRNSSALLYIILSSFSQVEPVNEASVSMYHVCLFVNEGRSTLCVYDLHVKVYF